MTGYLDTTDPRVPGQPDEAFRFDFPITGDYLTRAWREGYAAALRDMDAGKFAGDTWTDDDLFDAAEWGYVVEPYFNGHEEVKGAWVVVGHNGEIYGGIHNTRRDAEREAVTRWRRDEGIA